MAFITGIRKNGKEWIPKFIMELNKDTCIACGRCFKACAYACLALEEYEDEDCEKTYMTIVDDGACIGCEACSKACPKGCFTHAPVSA